MNFINKITKLTSNAVLGFDKSEYMHLLFMSLIVFIFIFILKKAFEKYYLSFEKNSIERYKHNYKSKLILNIILVISLFIIWEGHFSSMVTIVSFVSAGATIALKDIIYNFFAGLFIRFKKPFIIGDRIEINEIKGDVVSLNPLNFEVLEVGNRIHGEQSSGIIVSFPNAFVLNLSVKNYVKEFKYIWNEIVIKVPINSNIDNIKKELYKVISSDKILKEVPKKMEDQIDGISLNYHIYFNNLEPIIYTKIIDNHIELYVRYLVNPKKARFVEDNLWNQIIKLYQNKKIDLYIKED